MVVNFEWDEQKNQKNIRSARLRQRELETTT